MNRKNFVNAVAEKNPTVTKKTVAAITASVLETIQEAVVAGEAVQFQGFGTFKAVERAERTGHNPQTGESINIPACRAPKFVPGKSFREIVKG